MISAVLDTNILASGVLTASTPPRQIIDYWRNGKFELLISEHIIYELENTLRKPYFQNVLKAENIDDFLDLLIQDAALIPIITKVKGVATHPEDDIVLATAESGKAEYIVTGDHGLQSLKQFKRIKIVSPKIFVEMLQYKKN